MELLIQEKKENPLLKRTEVKALVNFSGSTPSKGDIAEALAKSMKADINLTDIRSVHNKFGLQEADVLAYVYDDIDAKVKNTVLTKHLRKKIEEEKKKAEEERKAAKEAKKKAEEEAKTATKEAEEKTKEGEQ